MQGTLNCITQTLVSSGQRAFERKFYNSTPEHVVGEINRTILTFNFWLKNPGKADLHHDGTVDCVDLLTTSVKVDDYFKDKLVVNDKNGWFFIESLEDIKLIAYD